MLEQVAPRAQLACPKIEREFLKTLNSILPPGCRPIMVTDAGFRAPWFRAVEAMSWHWIGRRPPPDPAQLVTIYSRRMQIELSFRDLKSHCYGQGFEDSLTRSAPRLQVLLLIHMLANFVAWLVGRACEASGLDAWLSPCRAKRRLYALVRLGSEAMVRNWPAGPPAALMDVLLKDVLLKPPPDLPTITCQFVLAHSPFFASNHAISRDLIRSTRWRAK